MATEPPTRPSPDDRDHRTGEAPKTPRSDTDPLHPADPRGRNPQAPGHTKVPAGGRSIPVVAIVIGIILVIGAILLLIIQAAR